MLLIELMAKVELTLLMANAALIPFKHHSALMPPKLLQRRACSCSAQAIVGVADAACALPERERERERERETRGLCVQEGALT